MPEYTRILHDGETISITGTHLGHNVPDFELGRNRHCINLSSIAGDPEVLGSVVAEMGVGELWRRADEERFGNLGTWQAARRASRRAAAKAAEIEVARIAERSSGASLVAESKKTKMLLEEQNATGGASGGYRGRWWLSWRGEQVVDIASAMVHRSTESLRAARRGDCREGCPGEEGGREGVCLVFLRQKFRRIFASFNISIFYKYNSCVVTTQHPSPHKQLTS